MASLYDISAQTYKFAYGLMPTVMLSRGKSFQKNGNYSIKNIICDGQESKYVWRGHIFYHTFLNLYQHRYINVCRLYCTVSSFSLCKFVIHSFVCFYDRHKNFKCILFAMWHDHWPINMDIIKENRGGYCLIYSNLWEYIHV